jgi:hypothetical protein
LLKASELDQDGYALLAWNLFNEIGPSSSEVTMLGLNGNDPTYLLVVSTPAAHSLIIDPTHALFAIGSNIGNLLRGEPISTAAQVAFNEENTSGGAIAVSDALADGAWRPSSLLAWFSDPNQAERLLHTPWLLLTPQSSPNTFPFDCIGYESVSPLDSLTSVVGTAADDILYGIPGSEGGGNYMDGGDGNDTYCVDSVHDHITDSSGTDTVITARSYALPDWIENLILLDDGGFVDGAGNDQSNTIVGSVYANCLWGGAGDDTLEGRASDDILDGGSGFNTAVYSGGRGMDYFVLRDTDGSVTITDKRPWSPDGRDTLLNIQSISIGGDDYSLEEIVVARTIEMVEGFSYVTLTEAPNGWHHWQTFTNQYDGKGNLRSQAGTYDDNGRWNQFWDVENTAAWATYVNGFDAAGTLRSQAGSYDDNGRWSQFWDGENTTAWTTYVNSFDAAGNLRSQAGTHDDNGSWSQFWDVENTGAWTTYVNSFDAVGNLRSQAGTYEHNGTWSRFWDVDNAYSWTDYTNTYDPAGTLISRVIAFDDGSMLIE